MLLSLGGEGSDTTATPPTRVPGFAGGVSVRTGRVGRSSWSHEGAQGILVAAGFPASGDLGQALDAGQAEIFSDVSFASTPSCASSPARRREARRGGVRGPLITSSEMGRRLTRDRGESYIAQRKVPRGSAGGAPLAALAHGGRECGPARAGSGAGGGGAAVRRPPLEGCCQPRAVPRCDGWARSMAIVLVFPIIATSAVGDWPTTGAKRGQPRCTAGGWEDREQGQRASGATQTPAKAPASASTPPSGGPTGGPTNLTVGPVGAAAPLPPLARTPLPRRFRPHTPLFRDSHPRGAVATSRRPAAGTAGASLGGAPAIVKPPIGPAPVLRAAVGWPPGAPTGRFGGAAGRTGNERRGGFPRLAATPLVGRPPRRPSPPPMRGEKCNHCHLGAASRAGVGGDQSPPRVCIRCAAQGTEGGVVARCNMARPFRSVGSSFVEETGRCLGWSGGTPYVWLDLVIPWWSPQTPRALSAARTKVACGGGGLRMLSRRKQCVIQPRSTRQRDRKVCFARA